MHWKCYKGIKRPDVDKFHVTVLGRSSVCVKRFSYLGSLISLSLYLSPFSLLSCLLFLFFTVSFVPHLTWWWWSSTSTLLHLQWRLEGAGTHLQFWALPALPGCFPGLLRLWVVLLFCPCVLLRCCKWLLPAIVLGELICFCLSLCVADRVIYLYIWVVEVGAGRDEGMRYYSLWFTCFLGELWFVFLWVFRVWLIFVFLWCAWHERYYALSKVSSLSSYVEWGALDFFFCWNTDVLCAWCLIVFYMVHG